MSALSLVRQGHLWHHLCGFYVVPRAVCGLCGTFRYADSRASCHPQHHQRDPIPVAHLSRHCIAHQDYVFRPSKSLTCNLIDCLILSFAGVIENQGFVSQNHFMTSLNSSKVSVLLSDQSK